ncbi:hypothetical protein DPMN_075689 [Dreissena polymorpha]|uniref:Uncharacterized protein n=1 Tax=Dreissena polymorpha TaxID=45954 RepID=A0A9D4BF45_DREPO|nr:hypothetical protein DPMN_075689 [Dreissena polymorpha]
MAQHAEPSSITINNFKLEVVIHLTNFGPTITDDLSLNAEINKRICKTPITLVRL